MCPYLKLNLLSVKMNKGIKKKASGCVYLDDHKVRVGETPPEIETLELIKPKLSCVHANPSLISLLRREISIIFLSV